MILLVTFVDWAKNNFVMHASTHITSIAIMMKWCHSITRCRISILNPFNNEFANRQIAFLGLLEWRFWTILKMESCFSSKNVSYVKNWRHIIFFIHRAEIYSPKGDFWLVMDLFQPLGRLFVCLEKQKNIKNLFD